MLYSSVMSSVYTFVDVTTSSWQTVHTAFTNITNHRLAYSNIAWLDLSSRWWLYLLYIFNKACYSWFQRPSWLTLTTDSHHVEVVHDNQLVDARLIIRKTSSMLPRTLWGVSSLCTYYWGTFFSTSCCGYCILVWLECQARKNENLHWGHNIHPSLWSTPGY
jgi:hypothetical protein